MTRDDFSGERGANCPDETRLAAYVDGGLDPRSRNEVAIHLADCVYCVAEVSSIVRMQESEPIEVPSALLARARTMARDQKDVWSWYRAAFATALTGFAAILLTLWVKPPQSTGPDGVRSLEAHTSIPELLEPADGASLRRDQIAFRWTPVDRAVSYEVRVLNADGNIVWTTHRDQTAVRLPAAADLRSGAQYFASVRAHLPDGNTLKSPITRFRVIEQ